MTIGQIDRIAAQAARARDLQRREERAERLAFWLQMGMVAALALTVAYAAWLVGTNAERTRRAREDAAMGLKWDAWDWVKAYTPGLNGPQAGHFHDADATGHDADATGHDADATGQGGGNDGAEGKPDGGTDGAEGRPNGGTAGGDPRTPHGRSGAEGGNTHGHAKEGGAK